LYLYKTLADTKTQMTSVQKKKKNMGESFRAQPAQGGQDPG